MYRFDMIQSSEMSTSQTKTAFYGKRKHKKSITCAGSPEPPVKKCETPRSARSNSDDSAYFSYVEFLRGDDVSDMETPVCADLLDSMSQHKHQDISTDSLRIHYKYLKSEIDPHEVEDHLYQRDAIDSQFYETCRETPNRSRRVDMLIKKVHYVALSKDSKILRQFVDSLHATDQCHVVEKLAEMFPETSFENDPPEEQLTGFLKEMKSSIYENVEPKYFIDDLVENGAISFNDHEDISAIACRRDRVACYMNKVNHARKSGGDRSLMRKIIQPMIHAYPKLYEEYTCRHKEESIEVPQVKVGSLVRVRCHIKGNKQQALLRHIERNCVKTFYENAPNYEEWLENIVEECRCSFEKLTISSVVIHLRTTQGDSLYRVFKACKEGKALQWLLSLLDEHDMTELKRLGPTKLQIKIVADENGNGDNLHQGQDCLCVINRNSILKNYKLFPKHVHDIDKLIELMCEQNLPGKEQLVTLNQFKAEKRNQKLFDFLLQKEIPQIYFCVLQKHIQKSGNSAFLQEVSQDDIEDTMSLSISDILEHEDYIKEEIDIRYFTPTIFSRETKTSNQLQRELQMCKSRRCRIDLLLRYLQEEDDISWFWDQLKVSQKYIWNAILSSKKSKYLSERDLLAFNILLNDRIVDEIDPLHLKTWMNDLTIQKLHFSDFERVSSRRTRAQCMMNRLSVDTVGLVIMALRRSGYEHVVEEIKAGSLSNRYECPRLLQRMQENKCVFHYQFEMNFDLPEYDCKYYYTNLI
ncbi:uncharacterized protein LOC123562870 [Mercenaria mercenaria]|uniref:uncharacterized protein LOC123562870 n=1 Tax=Mercenaria mercenaria TaxID=6596 RepID=UPI00234EA901|nr:uncharacterized protein LOC123562870 [Mercenaria mercenaria]